MGGNQNLSPITPASAALGVGLAEIGVVLVVLAFLIVLVVLVVANRAEPDSRGLRGFNVYLFGVSFVTLFAAYLGSIVIVTGIVRLFSPHDLPIANDVARQVAIGAIILLMAGATWRYHFRRGLDISRGDSSVDGPNARILHTYVAAVGFVMTLIAVIAFSVAIYRVLDLLGPGVFGSGLEGRGPTVRALVDIAWVALAAAGIVLWHLQWGPPRLLPAAFRRNPGGGAGGIGAPPPQSPMPPPVASPTAAPAPMPMPMPPPPSAPPPPVAQPQPGMPGPVQNPFQAQPPPQPPQYHAHESVPLPPFPSGPAAPAVGMQAEQPLPPPPPASALPSDLPPPPEPPASSAIPLPPPPSAPGEPPQQL